jgi:hypothetical protein
VILSIMLAIALVIGSIVGAVYFTSTGSNKAAAPVGNIATTLPSPAVPSADMPQYGPTDNSTALEIRHQYPEYFGCGAYPADTALKVADLIPTANVNAVFTYNTRKGAYDIASDPRITAVSKMTTEIGDGGKNYALQTVTLTFAPGVHYYHAYGQEMLGDGLGWTGTRYVYNPKDASYHLALLPGNGATQPLAVVIATDPATCHNGSIGLPAAFSWENVTSKGLNEPEFYEGLYGHPQN